MLDIKENISLKQYNTFGIDAKAQSFVSIDKAEQLKELFLLPGFKNTPKLILGGGSNMLFTKDYEGLVIRLNIQGITAQEQDTDVFITAGAGVVWHSLVQYTVAHGYAGMENLSLIPGTVGASPVQNVGAYGVEIKDIFHSCQVFIIETGELKTFNKQDCHFGYRDSIFKNELKGKVIVTEVTYKLSTQATLNTSYGAIEQELKNRNIVNPTIGDISKVVSDIRVSKLPDPSTIGNAGSFFKNPIVSQELSAKVLSSFPDTVYYCMPNSTIKLAAGWLIEQCGWKGKRIGEVGTWKNQALVLVNHGNATGEAIYALSEQIIADVKQKFDVDLEREVNVL